MLGAEVIWVELRSLSIVGSCREESELFVGNRADARVMPVLVLRRRESERGEAIQTGATQSLYRIGHGRFARQRVERGGVAVDWCHRSHRLAPALAEPFPFASLRATVPGSA